jgi:hypothetical protein
MSPGVRSPNWYQSLLSADPDNHGVYASASELILCWQHRDGRPNMYRNAKSSGISRSNTRRKQRKPKTSTITVLLVDLVPVPLFCVEIVDLQAPVHQQPAEEAV